MRMAEGRDGAGFALEPLTELGMRDLDRNNPVEACVAGFVHFAHSTRTQGVQNLIWTEFCPAIQPHYSIPSSPDSGATRSEGG